MISETAYSKHLRHDATDAGEDGRVELSRLGEFQMFDDMSVRLSYSAGLERFLLAVLAVFCNQLGRFLGLRTI